MSWWNSSRSILRSSRWSSGADLVSAYVMQGVSACPLTSTAISEEAKVSIATAATLASRIPHFEEVTPEKLAQVDAAEECLRSLGFSDCRVRHHGDVARIELPAAELVRGAQLADQIDAGVRAAGFRFAALDLRGIQSGAFTLPLVGVRGS